MLTGQKAVAIHLSLPSFPPSSELLVFSRRGEVFPRNIARTAGVPARPQAFHAAAAWGGLRGFDGHLRG